MGASTERRRVSPGIVLWLALAMVLAFYGAGELSNRTSREACERFAAGALRTAYREQAPPLPVPFADSLSAARLRLVGFETHPLTYDGRDYPRVVVSRAEAVGPFVLRASSGYSVGEFGLSSRSFRVVCLFGFVVRGTSELSIRL